MTMLRGVASKVAWVGRTASMVFGLALVLALIVGVASMALGANGKPLLLGRNNTANAITKLTSNANESAMEVENKNGGADDTALELIVQQGEPPMKVNTAEKVVNLHADYVDGQNADFFLKSFTYRTETQLGAGTPRSDGTHLASIPCSPGDKVLSGGPANIDSTSTLLESFPIDTETWVVRINKNGGGDTFSVIALCADQTLP